MRSEAPKEEWTKLRNRNECEVLAQVLDALVLDHDSTAAIEILARRFVGVKHADKSGNWHFADVLAKDMPKRTLLRPSVLSSVLREAKNLTLLENGGYNRAGGSSSSSAAGRNDRGGRDGDRQSFRGGRNDFRSRGGRSAQPNSGGGGGYNGNRQNTNSSSSNATSNSGPSSAASAAGSASQNTGRGGQGQ